MNGTEPFEAQTLSDKTVFLDWFHQDAAKVWANGLLDMWEELVPYDGIWLDMNTPTIFCEGGRPLCANDRQPEFAKRHLAENGTSTDWYTSYSSENMKEKSTYYLPFIPQLKNLDHQTIALNATHSDNKKEKNYTQYDIHSMFGHMQAKTTWEILSNATVNNRNNTQYDLRKLITSSSTFAGSGKYAQHNLAKMTRSWEHLKYSIAQIMNFNMFGIPFTGADVCGNRQIDFNQPESEQ